MQRPPSKSPDEMAIKQRQKPVIDFSVNLSRRLRIFLDPSISLKPSPNEEQWHQPLMNWHQLLICNKFNLIWMSSMQVIRECDSARNDEWSNRRPEYKF